MSLLCFWALIMLGSLRSMEGQRALWFHQKYLNLCSKDERRSYGVGTTRGWVINDRIIFGWTIPLNSFQNLRLEIFHLHVKFRIAWMPIEMTGSHPQNFRRTTVNVTAIQVPSQGHLYHLLRLNLLTFSVRKYSKSKQKSRLNFSLYKMLIDVVESWMLLSILWTFILMAPINCI